VSNIVQLNYGEKKLHNDDNDVCFVLDQKKLTCTWIFILLAHLKQQYAIRYMYVAPFGHILILSQTGEKQQIPILNFFLNCKLNEHLRKAFLSDFDNINNTCTNLLTIILNPINIKQVKSLGSFIKQSLELRTGGT